MKFLFSLSLHLIILSAAAVDSFAQSNKKGGDANVHHKLTGTWALIDFANSDSLGNWIYPLGRKPRGFVTYTRTNIFNINMSSEVPLGVSEKDSKTSSIILDEFLWKYSFGYFGTYTVDFKKSVVTHQVKGGTIPWFVGTDQQRPFILKGDTLIIGDNKTWKRVLVKAD